MYGSRDIHRIARGLGHQGSLQQRSLSQCKVDLIAYRAVEAEFLGVTGNADNGHPRLSFIKREAPPDRVLTGPAMPGDRLVQYGNPWVLWTILPPEIAPSQDRNVHGAEIVRGHDAKLRGWGFLPWIY